MHARRRIMVLIPLTPAEETLIPLMPLMKTRDQDQKAIRILLFVLVLFACAAAAGVGIVAGWKAGAVALGLLMLPAAAIYRFSGRD
jgi:fatty acid desaturase